MQRIFVMIITSFFLILLTSCTSVKPLQYTYQPPLDQEGAQCISDHCEKSKSQCLQIGYNHHPECRPADEFAQPGGKACRQLRKDCSDQFSGCYAMCGGKVYVDDQCISCDATRTPEE